MLCSIEEWSNEIQYSYPLSPETRTIFQDIISANINNEKIPSAGFQILDQFRDDISTFFAKHPGKSYFLRLSTASPKDAYYNLDGRDETEESLDAMSRLELLRRELAPLKVSSPEQAIKTLTHSVRVLLELNQENSIVLLPWKDISYETEIRCFVKNSKLICFAHYYDIPVPNALELAQKVVDFFKTFSPHYENCVVDVHIPDQVELIEYNPYDFKTDSLYFEWDEINECKNITYKTIDHTFIYNGVDFTDFNE